MVWLRNKYGGWFEIPDDEYQIHKTKQEAEKLNAEERKRDIDKHATQLIDRAKAAEPQVTKDLQEVVKSDNAELAGLEYRIKGKKSLSDKLDRKALEKKISVEAYAKKVTDVLRYTELSNDNNLVDNFNSFVSKMKAKGYEMVEVNNTWYDGSVYKGINTLMRTKNGYTFEMQFHTAKSLEIKEINHKLYEVSRKPSTPQSEVDRLELEMKHNAEKVSIPRNISSIKDKQLH